MNIKQLTFIFEVYGSKPEGWPVDKVKEIYDLLETNSDAISLKKEFDEMIYEIVRSRTLYPTEEVDKLIIKISPQIDKINNILNDKLVRA